VSNNNNIVCFETAITVFGAVCVAADLFIRVLVLPLLPLFPLLGLATLCRACCSGGTSRSMAVLVIASFQENNLDESFVQIPAADSVYAPPYANFLKNNQDNPFMHILLLGNGQ
jgi:hypothetical protein